MVCLWKVLAGTVLLAERLFIALTALTAPVRWHRQTHCVSIPAGLDCFGAQPKQENGPGDFFDCPSASLRRKIIFRAMHRDPGFMQQVAALSFPSI